MNDLIGLADETLRRVKAGEILELKIVAERLALAAKAHVCLGKTFTLIGANSGEQPMVFPTVQFFSSGDTIESKPKSKRSRKSDL